MYGEELFAHERTRFDKHRVEGLQFLRVLSFGVNRLAGLVTHFTRIQRVASALGGCEVGNHFLVRPCSRWVDGIRH